MVSTIVRGLQEGTLSFEALCEAINPTDKVLILTHNNPDPDAIASAVALRHLLAEGVGLEALIAYNGIIGRAESKALIRYLKNPLQRLSQMVLPPDQCFALVDTQPSAGNNALPPEARVAIVIDHHPRQEATAGARFSDVRPHVGSSATIMVEYLRTAGLQPDPPLATALFYGIKTDTMGLSRGTTSADMSAICYLLPLIDLEALLKIERAEVPLSYLESFAASLQTTRIYNNVIISTIETMHYPDLTAEMADFLLRVKGIRWIVCMGVFNNRLYISVRTKKRGGAGKMIQKVIGERGIAGGHRTMAGGQVPLADDDDPEQIITDFTRQFLQYLGIPAEAQGKPIDRHRPDPGVSQAD